MSESPWIHWLVLYKKPPLLFFFHSTMNGLRPWSTNDHKPATGLSQLLHEYGSNSSIHGVSYILSNTGHICDRLLWLVIFLTSGLVTVMLTMRSYNTWQEHLVITTLQDMDSRVEDMEFPAVTICAPGLHKDLLEKALLADYADWKVDTNNNEEKSFENFMLEKFEIDNQNITIMDIIDTMIAPSEESNIANIVLQNEMACRTSDKRTGKNQDSGN